MDLKYQYGAKEKKNCNKKNKVLFPSIGSNSVDFNWIIKPREKGPLAGFKVHRQTHFAIVRLKRLALMALIIH